MSAKSYSSEKRSFMTNNNSLKYHIWELGQDRSICPEHKPQAEELYQKLFDIENLLKDQPEAGIAALIELRGREEVQRWHNEYWVKVEAEIEECRLHEADRSICPELYRWPEQEEYEPIMATHDQVPWEFTDFVDPSQPRWVWVPVKQVAA